MWSVMFPDPAWFRQSGAGREQRQLHSCQRGLLRGRLRDDGGDRRGRQPHRDGEDGEEPAGDLSHQHQPTQSVEPGGDSSLLNCLFSVRPGRVGGDGSSLPGLLPLRHLGLHHHPGGHAEEVEREDHPDTLRHQLPVSLHHSRALLIIIGRNPSRYCDLIGWGLTMFCAELQTIVSSTTQAPPRDTFRATDSALVSCSPPRTTRPASDRRRATAVLTGTPPPGPTPPASPCSAETPLGHWERTRSATAWTATSTSLTPRPTPATTSTPRSAERPGPWTGRRWPWDL